MKLVSRPRSLFSFHALLFLPLAALLLASPALAQKKPKKNWLSGRFDLFAEGGGSFFKAGPTFTYTTFPPLALNVTKLSLQSSGRLFVGVDFRFTPHDAFQLSYSYSPANVKYTNQEVFPSLSKPVSYGFSLREHILSADYLRTFSVTKHWQPFLAAGIGKVWWQPTPQSNFDTNLGVGVDYGLSSKWAIRLENRAFVSRFPTANDSISYNLVPTIGPVFRF